MNKVSNYILPVIVISQFLCTSLWFAGNSVASDIVKDFHIKSDFLANITSIIQFGFISGTLVFALFGISDRYSPSKVFFVCAILASLFNLGILFENVDINGILFFRFLTGFFLAGIYPVGMKIASDYYQEGLGRSLGYLVGALVLGTALPHLLKNFSLDLSWKYVFYSTSMLAIVGGISILLLIPDGPYRKKGQQLKIISSFTGFRDSGFRSVSFGYFGHMWELYTFWAFVPLMISTYNDINPGKDLNIPLFSFLIIASGATGCVFGGIISRRYGTKNIAALALSISCLCCLLSPLLLFTESVYIFLVFLFIWGISVVADSPLFSTLVAQNAPTNIKGSSITIVVSIGFAITILSIQCIGQLINMIGPKFIFMFLAFGPIFGLIALFKKKYEL